MSEPLPENESKQEIKIEKGIPLPPLGRPPIYPWQEMEVGDSFLVSSSHNRIHNIAYATNKHLSPKRFAVRRQPDGSYRVWRVE